MMNSFYKKYGLDYNEALVLWKNEVPDVNVENDVAVHRKRFITYQVPRGLGEKYLYSIMKTAEDVVNSVTENAKWMVQRYKTHGNGDGNGIVMNENAIQEYRDAALPKQKPQSDFPKLRLLNGATILDSHVAMPLISQLIEDNWNLDKKYVYTIKKTNTVDINGSTKHNFKVEFSVPTKEYPIPQITVSAFFTVEITPLQSLPVYVKYQLETDSREYVVGKDSFKKARFERLFKIKRDAYMDINKYPGWSSGPSH